jgi:translocation and assembly module TamB
VTLKKISLIYCDDQNGLNTGLYLGKLVCGFDVFDLSQHKIHFGTIDLSNTALHVILTPAAAKPEAKQTGPGMDIAFSKVNLSGIKTKYENREAGQNLNADIGTLVLALKSMDLNTQQFDIRELSLADSRIRYVQNKTQSPTSLPVAEQPTKKASWAMLCRELQLKNNFVEYKNANSIPAETGIDYNNLSLSHILISCSDIQLKPGLVSFDMKDMSLTEKSGLDLKRFSGKASFDSTHVELAGFDLQANNTRLGPYLYARYPSLAWLKNAPGLVFLKANLNRNTIALSDVLFFAPDLIKQKFFADNKSLILSLQSRMQGTVADLQVSQLELGAGTDTYLALNGNLKGLPDVSKLYADLSLTELKTRRKALEGFFPGQLPAQLSIPDTIALSGAFKGYVKNFDGTLNLSTSLGEAQVQVKMNPAAGNTESPYAVDVHVKEFDLGRLLNKTDLLGKITLDAGLKGHGLDTTSFQGDLNTTIRSAVFKGYTYENLQVNGAVSKTSFDGKASIDCKDLSFQFDGKLDFGSRAPQYVFKLDLIGADLLALHLSKEDLRISGTLFSDLHKSQGKNSTGKAGFVNGLVIKNNVHYPLDSIVLHSSYTGDVADISLKSEFIHADFIGQIHLDELSETVSRQMQGYFSRSAVVKSSPLAPEKFDFQVDVENNGMLSQVLLPDLEVLLPSHLQGSYNSESKKMDLDLSVPQLVYAGTKLDSVRIRLNTNAELLKYSIHFNEISSELAKIENLALSGDVGHNLVHYQLNSLRDDSSKMISVGGVLKSVDSAFELRFNPDLVLNKVKWTIDPANYLVFGVEKLYAHQLICRHEQESFSVNSGPQRPYPDLNISFHDFHLTGISRIIESKDSLIKGVVDGDISLKKNNSKIGFTADVAVKNLVLKGAQVGDLAIHADDNTADKYALKLVLSGNQNDLKLEGFYVTGVSDNNLAMTLDIKNLNLASIEPFTFGQVTEMSGALSGQLSIGGGTNSPDMRGTLNFKKAGLKPKIIDSYLRINNSALVLDSRRIKFNSFVLTDTLSNTAEVNGYADIHELKNIAFDMKIRTSNFLALNTTVEDNPDYFGKVYLSSTIQLSGDMTHPVLNLKAKLNKGTSVTYVKSDDQLAEIESKGIIEFMDTAGIRGRIMNRKQVVMSKGSNVKGLDLRASIEIDENTKMKMIVDPAAGDSLIVRGIANLDFSLEPSGKTSLTGTYRVYSGSYHLAINDFVKRDFKIDRGSQITWSGDVLDAYLDISAIYTVKTAPLDLVESQVAGMTEAQKNVYRTNLTFLVYLKMKGSLDKPEISFDIQQPENERGVLNGSVDARLNQIRDEESVLNKQVFALITLNRFIAEDPLDNSGGGDGFSSAARSSASQMLSQQLSRVSGKYVKGVDLNVGLESYDDYSSGQVQGRTQVKLGLSKELLNKRVTVQVGGNVDVEGEKAKQNNASEIAGNMLIEYKLTEDARYKLKGFRKNEYENPIEGELTKTGIGVIFTKDYNTMKELMKRRAKVKKP